MKGFDTWMRFVLAVLATWRLTHLLADEDGPGDLVVRLRTSLGQSILGELMDCFNCLSFWVAVPFALLVTLKPLDLFLSWLALSGAACLLERMGQQPVSFHSATQAQGEISDGMLRSEESPTQEPVSLSEATGVRDNG